AAACENCTSFTPAVSLFRSTFGMRSRVGECDDDRVLLMLSHCADDCLTECACRTGCTDENIRPNAGNCFYETRWWLRLRKWLDTRLELFAVSSHESFAVNECQLRSRRLSWHAAVDQGEQDQFGSAGCRRARSRQHDFLFGEGLVRDTAGSENASKGDSGSALNIVIETSVLLVIAVK